MKHTKIDWFELSFYYPLYPYQKLIDAISTSKDLILLVSRVRIPLQLILAKYFFLLYLLRCCAVIFLKPTTATKWRRIALGVEVMRKDWPYIETTILLWTAICYCYTQFTISTKLKDYAFLRLLRMSSNGTQHHFSHFGLTASGFGQFKIFRWAAKWYYHSAASSIAGFACLAFAVLYFKDGLLADTIFISGPWMAVQFIWCYVVTTVLFSNYALFFVVMRYIRIKQNAICEKIIAELGAVASGHQHRVRSSPGVTLRCSLRLLSQLNAELEAYSHFWCSYISFVFLFFICLLSFILYICLYVSLGSIVKLIYWTTFSFHVLTMSTIIYMSGAVVQGSQRIREVVNSGVVHCLIVGGGVNSRLGLKTLIQLQLATHNLGAISPSGFYLLNGYQVTHQTFQLIIANFVIYFLLILQHLIHD